MEFSKQEYWSRLPFSSPGDLPNPGIEPGSPSLQADSLPSDPPAWFIKMLDYRTFLFWGDFEAFSLHYNILLGGVIFDGSRASFWCLSKIPCLYKKVVVVLVTQSCSTLCYPTDCSLPGSSVHWILQARILEWVAISLSRGSSQTKVSLINFQRTILCDISSMYWKILWSIMYIGIYSQMS